MDINAPKVLHLIAMKLHALKYNAQRRYGRDMPDILELVRVNNLDVADPAFKDTCLRFGTAELYNDLILCALRDLLFNVWNP